MSERVESLPELHLEVLPERGGAQREPSMAGERLTPSYNPGDLMVGRYRVIRVVAWGGMG